MKELKEAPKVHDREHDQPTSGCPFAKHGSLFLYLVPAFLLLAAWHFYTQSNPNSQFVFSSPQLVFDKLRWHNP